LITEDQSDIDILRRINNPSGVMATLIGVGPIVSTRYVSDHFNFGVNGQIAPSVDKIRSEELSTSTADTPAK
jgi:hypothetical protein